MRGPTPHPAPGRGSPRRRTGSGAGRKNSRPAPALEPRCVAVAVKGTLRRASPALDRAHHAYRAPDRGTNSSPDSVADRRLSSKSRRLC